jgi:hypothetical protein
VWEEEAADLEDEMGGGVLAAAGVEQLDRVRAAKKEKQRRLAALAALREAEARREQAAAERNWHARERKREAKEARERLEQQRQGEAARRRQEERLRLEMKGRRQREEEEERKRVRLLLSLLPRCAWTQMQLGSVRHRRRRQNADGQAGGRWHVGGRERRVARGAGTTASPEPCGVARVPPEHFPRRRTASGRVRWKW